MKRLRVVLSTSALRDVTSMIEYITTRHGDDDAARAYELIEKAIVSLESLPNRGRLVPELEHRAITAYREVIASPYRIIYKVTDNEVWILAVVDGRRDVDEMLYERARR